MAGVIPLRTRLAVLFVALCLGLVGLLILLAQNARARPPVPPDVFRAVRAEWKPKSERVNALDVVWCESRYSTTATNGQYVGLFQMGTWARARYGHGWTASAQSHAAHRYYVECGWSGWTCA